ncbi:hypothetical protein PIB30_042782, partial [Stylosanthes scabra]|nr:hypothetical protein [Stylosanthes scabra]
RILKSVVGCHSSKPNHKNLACIMVYTFYKLCKDARVPLREFKRTSRIPQEKPITAKRMETTRLPRNIPQQQDEDDEDEPMPQAEGSNEEDQEQQQYHQFQQPPQQH